ASPPRVQRWRDEPDHASFGTRQCEAVLQGAAHAGHRVELRVALGAGDQGTAQPHWVSRSTTGDGGGRARSSRHSEAHPRCQATPAEELEEFDFNQAHQIPAAKIRELAEGGYIERAEPVVFMGECGTGKTHLAPRLCKALLDRITDQAHIIETGTESYRFRRTLEVRQKKKAS